MIKRTPRLNGIWQSHEIWKPLTLLLALVAVCSPAFSVDAVRRGNIGELFIFILMTIHATATSRVRFYSSRSNSIQDACMSTNCVFQELSIVSMVSATLNPL